MEKMVRLIDLKTRQASVVSLSCAAEIAQLDEAEVLWAVEEFGQCETDLHMIVEPTDDIAPEPTTAPADACFALQSDGRLIGHFRCLGNAQALAATLSAALITELHSTEPIICDDDPLH